jgi:hypothetical protein
MNSANWRRWFAAAVALVVLAGFLYVYWRAMVWAFQSVEKPAKFDGAYIYVATALAGLVGAIVAMIFNEKLPEPAHIEDRSGPKQPRASRAAPGPRAALFALRRSVVPSQLQILSFMSAAYVLGYLLTGIAAIAVWVMLGDRAPDLIKNLALISIGLLIAIARSFFTVPAA